MASAPLNNYNRNAVKCIANQDSTNPSIPHRYTGRNSQITNDRIVYKKENGEEIKLPLYNEKSVDISLTPNRWIPFATPSGIQYLPIYSINNPQPVAQIIGANGTRSNFTTVEGKACNLCYENCNTNYVNCERCVGGCNECNSCQGCQSCQSCTGSCNSCVHCDTCVSCQKCNSSNSDCSGCHGTCYSCYGCLTCVSNDSCSHCHTSSDGCDPCHGGCYTSSCKGSINGCCDSGEDGCDSCDTGHLSATPCVTSPCNNHSESYTCYQCHSCNSCQRCTGSCDGRCNSWCVDCESCNSCYSSSCNGTCDGCNTCNGCQTCDFCQGCNSNCYEANS